MELKNYQKEVLADLELFIKHLQVAPNEKEAYQNFWKEKGIPQDMYYKERMAKVPYVSFKVPTAWGKTYISVNALKNLVDTIPLGSPRVVLWFVPWDNILTQTLKAFRNVDHPYRRRLDELFWGRVSVLDKEAVLSWASFNASSVVEEVTIVILSLQSFRASEKGKEARKVFEENGNLSSFQGKFETGIEIPGADTTSLIKVLHNLNPIVVVDESHRAQSKLSEDMLTNINPRFILGLTATPQTEANIISYVDAIKLKNEHMVKLPVVAYNLPSRDSVIEKAVNLRKQLEQKAKELQEQGGKYIRPIVLFQAESRTNDESINFDRLKEQLIKWGIPEQEIAIKVAEKDEIKAHDLLSPDCPIRYIITVNALKEWWDCPFAYVLASLANRSSVTDITQILWRVLRQPYVRFTPDARLNIAYVLSSSLNFHATIDEIIKWLNASGFWKEDVTFENLDTQISMSDNNQKLALEFGQQIPLSQDTKADIIDIQTWALSSQNAQISNDPIIEKIFATAILQEEQFQEEVKSMNQLWVSRELLWKWLKIFNVKASYKEIVSTIEIPQFFFSHQTQLTITDDDIPLDKEELSKGFSLLSADANIILEWWDAEMYQFDINKDDSSVFYKRISQEGQKLLLEYIETLPPESQLRSVAEIIRKSTGRLNSINDREIIAYIERILKQVTESTLEYIKKSPYNAWFLVGKKIEKLLTEYREAQFYKLIESDKILLKWNWTFPEQITPWTVLSLEKWLYEKENGEMNGFEQRSIEAFASLDNIVFWHRNDSRKWFCINGGINHYPDFILYTQSWKIIMIETKGWDRDNSDSKAKLRLWQAWAGLSNWKCKYFMLFEKNAIDGAYTANDLKEVIRGL
jgi:type III restriction enzyme